MNGYKNEVFVDQRSEAVSLLAEMFPTVDTSELVHCLSLAAGSVDAAAQHVLERVELANECCSGSDELPSSVFIHCYGAELIAVETS